MLDDDLLVVINGWWEPLDFTLPDVGAPRAWQKELDTFDGTIDGTAGSPPGQALAAGAVLTVGPRSLILLRSARSS